MLVRSPRSEIRRLSDRLVDGGLPVEEKVRIEGKVEADGETSALVVQIGAIAMYPAIVPPRADYHDTLQTIAHEWVHHYLYFAPLGRSFYNGDKLITLNETVANLVGVELGDRLFERYPLEAAPAFVVGDGDLVIAAGGGGGRDVATGVVNDDEALVMLPGGRSERRPYVGTVLDDVVGWDDRRGSNGTMSLATLSRSAVGPTRSFATLRMTTPTNPPGFTDAEGLAQAEFDFGREMRGLRLEVDGLLAEGRVADAELVMDERRQVFVANGYYIRRINQAYFAFHGSYADTPASSDPIGPKMQRLRDASVSLKVFLETAREFTSEDDLDSALR